VTFLVTAKYARKETVTGVLTPSAGSIRVVAQKPGRVVNVKVEENQIVTAGDPLVTISLDPTVSGAGTTLGRLLESSSDNQLTALKEESRAHSESLSDQRASLEAKRNGLEVHLDRLTGDLALQRDRIRLESESLKTFKELNDQKVISDIQYRDRAEQLVQARQEESAIVKDMDDTRAAIAENAAERERIGNDAAEARAQQQSASAVIAEKRATYYSPGRQAGCGGDHINSPPGHHAEGDGVGGAALGAFPGSRICKAWRQRTPAV
jgi:membrane fusion protein